MREIKFRGLGENGWVYGDLFSAWAVGGLHPRIHWTEGTASFNQGVRPESVGEYIGRKDKNDQEVYEGDILKDDAGELYEVLFGKLPLIKAGDCVCTYEAFYAKCYRKLGQAPMYECKEIEDYMEIIGNTTENPELVEAKE